MKKWLWMLDFVSGILMLLASAMVFFYAPREVIMGDVQRIFYFHVAAGWVGMLAFFVALLASMLLLIRSEMKWDNLAVSAVEIGLVFMLINILSGAIWAKPIWNTWWTWDPRLTTVTIMELIYLSYLVLRRSIENVQKRARFAAVYAMIGFVSVPMTYFSIRLFRTIHPVIVSGFDSAGLGSFEMTSRMLQTLLCSLLAFTFLFVSLLVHRYQLEKSMDALAEQLDNL